MKQLVCCPLCIFAHVFCLLIKSTCLLSSGLNAWLLLLFKSFINNDREHLAYHTMLLYQCLKFQIWMWISLEQYWLLMLFFTNNVHPLTACWCWLLLIILILAGLSHHVMVLIWMIIESTFLMQHTGSRICYISLKKAFWLFLDQIAAWFYSQPVGIV